MAVVYGIKKGGNANKINSYLGHGINVFFSEVEEAKKVVEYYNERTDDGYYVVFKRTLQSLERVKRGAFESPAIRNDPVKFKRLTQYVIYDTAEHYLEDLQNANNTTL